MYNAAKPFSDQNYKSSIKKEMLKINKYLKKVRKNTIKILYKSRRNKILDMKIN